MQFFHTVKLHSLTYSVWDPLGDVLRVWFLERWYRVVHCVCKDASDYPPASKIRKILLHRLYIQGVRVRDIQKYILIFSTQKLYAIYVFNSVQSNSKRFLCTSVHFNVGRDDTTFLDETFPGRWVGRGGHTA